MPLVLWALLPVERDLTDWWTQRANEVLERPYVCFDRRLTNHSYLHKCYALSSVRAHSEQNLNNIKSRISTRSAPGNSRDPHTYCVMGTCSGPARSRLRGSRYPIRGHQLLPICCTAKHKGGIGNSHSQTSHPSQSPAPGRSPPNRSSAAEYYVEHRE